MPLEMLPVTSSAIGSAAFDPDARELHIEWKSGTTSVHPDWTEEKHAAFLAADSKGQHFHREIRKQHPGRMK